MAVCDTSLLLGMVAVSEIETSGGLVGDGDGVSVGMSFVLRAVPTWVGETLGKSLGIADTT
jgi:hypothetical protein